MGQENRFAPFIVLLVLIVVLQAGFIALDCVQTPARVAKQFAKDYYYLDADMQKYLCDALAQSDAVGDYLYEKQDEAGQRGLSTKNLRQLFTHLNVEITHEDSNSAKAHLEGTTRIAINPAFMVIGKLFFLADQYPMEATLDLVKQDDGWKVCGKPFGLQPSE